MLSMGTVLRSDLPPAPGEREAVETLPELAAGDELRSPADLRAQADALCRTIAQFHARGWCLGTSGNFSLRLGRRPLRLLITPSGLDKGRLRPEELLVVGADGRPVEGHDGQPSAETLIHLAVVEAADAGAVFHTHSMAATLLGERFLPRGGFTLRGYEMLKGLAGTTTHEAAVWVPVLANSQDMEELAGRVRGVLRDLPGLAGLLLAGHGLYTWGAGIEEARRQVECFEFLFECAARRTTFAPFDGE